MTPTLTPEEVEAQLRAYGRNHSSATVEQALEWAAADIIADLRRELDEALAKCSYLDDQFQACAANESVANDSYQKLSVAFSECYARAEAAECDLAEARVQNEYFGSLVHKYETNSTAADTIADLRRQLGDARADSERRLDEADHWFARYNEAIDRAHAAECVLSEARAECDLQRKRVEKAEAALIAQEKTNG